MSKRTLTTNLAILLIAVVMMAPAVMGQEGTTKYGVKFGLVSPGEVTIEDVGSDDMDMSYSLGGFLDYQLAPKLYGGVSIDLHNAKYGDVDKTLFDLSVTLKAMVSQPEATTKFRPFGAIGYGSMGGIDGADGTSYFLVKAGVEMLFESKNSTTWLGEVSLIAAPSGGNSDASVTFGPGFLLRGGILF